MKTIIYTYRHKEPVFFELDRYYFIKSQKKLDRLINRLLDIDAVGLPLWEKKPKFPLFLELKSGFAPNLIEAKRKDLKAHRKSLKKLSRKVKA